MQREGVSQEVARHCMAQARLLAYRTGLLGFCVQGLSQERPLPAFSYDAIFVHKLKKTKKNRQCIGVFHWQTSAAHSQNVPTLNPVIFFPEDHKVGVGAVIWAKGDTVSSEYTLFFYIIQPQTGPEVLFCSCLRPAADRRGVCISSAVDTTLTRPARST